MLVYDFSCVEGIKKFHSLLILNFFLPFHHTILPASAQFFLSCKNPRSLTAYIQSQYQNQLSKTTLLQNIATTAKMISLTFSLLSLIALSVAQNHTVSLFLPAADLQSLVGSIVGGVRHSEIIL